LESARTLARLGASVVIGDLHPVSVESLLPDHEGALSVALDVTRSADIAAAVEETVSTFDGLHIVVNAAGIARSASFEDVSEKEWLEVIDVNLTGTFLVCRAALPHLRSAGWGRIVNFSSTAGKVPSTAAGPHYTAAKHGVLGLTRHLAKEVGRHGITVNAVCPGLIDTPMLWGLASRESVTDLVRAFPVSRVGRPTEVAELVAFLASDRAAYITGAAIDINGGEVIG
jgi:NAD(P)-dependent dehydrogenase (short-subunit alcohol dehydrogenase family)